MKKEFGIPKLFFAPLIALSIFCLFQPQLAHANPPQSVQITYNLVPQILSVTITHDSSSKGSHYIKFVEIKKNGSTFTIKTYDSQPTGTTFTYNYKIPAIEEDTFEVTASCNREGSATSSLYSVTK